MKIARRFVLLIALVTVFASCSTQRTAATRPANVEMVSLNKKNATVGKNESSSTAASKENQATKKLVSKYAALMQVDDGTLDNITLIRFIDEWYGVPYKYGGDNKNGIDCSGFTCTLFKQVYNDNVNGTSASLYQQCKPVKRNDLNEGDLVFFKINRSRISHVGVYIANNYFVHSSTKAGVVLSSLDEPYYRKYYVGGGRLKK